jgi:hypothetical protein
LNTQNAESKNIVQLDEEADRLIERLEQISPSMITHDGISAPRQYYEGIKKKEGRKMALLGLNLLIKSHEERCKILHKELIGKPKDKKCSQKKKSQ